MSEWAVLRAAIGGGVSTVPWIVAAAGWAAHWNALVNLALTLVGGELWGVLIYVLRYESPAVSVGGLGHGTAGQEGLELGGGAAACGKSEKT